MNLHITSLATKTQISFLISLDGFIARKKDTKTAQFIKRINEVARKKYPDFKIRIIESNKHKIDFYTENLLIGYYL